MITHPVPVLYINLDTAVDRRLRLESAFKVYGIQEQRLEAVRWARLTPDEQTRFYSARLNSKQYHSPMVDGEKGCYASHIEAWRWLLSTDFFCMVVLEDDVCLTPDFLKVVGAVSRLDMSWDMVKLIGRQQEKVAATRDLCPGFELIDYARIPSYTAGYVVSRSGAEKMLATRIPFGRPIDVDMRFWWENGLNVFGVWPAVLMHDETSSASTIAGRHAKKNLFVRWRKLKMKLSLTLWNIWHRFKRGSHFTDSNLNP